MSLNDNATQPVQGVDFSGVLPSTGLQQNDTWALLTCLDAANHAGKEIYHLKDDVCIFGRGGSNSQYKLHGGQFSRNHFKICRTLIPIAADKSSPQYFIEDMGSSNGTRLNGQPIPPKVSKPLSIGSRISIAAESVAYSFIPTKDLNVHQGMINRRYTIDGELLDGAYGKVFHGRDMETNTFVAIKEVENISYGMDEAGRRLAEAELKAMQRSNGCEHIVEFKDHVQTTDPHQVVKQYIVMELCSGGDVFEMVQKGIRMLREHRMAQKKGTVCAGYLSSLEFADKSVVSVSSYSGLPMDTIKKWIYQAAQGLIELKNLGIVHRDVKPENILLTNPSYIANAKLADLGLAGVTNDIGQVSRRTLTAKGTNEYKAPEVSLRQECSVASDVWSLGVTCWFMAVNSFNIYFKDLDPSCRPSFDAVKWQQGMFDACMKNKSSNEKILAMCKDYLESGVGMVVDVSADGSLSDPYVDSSLVAFLEAALKIDPDERISLEKLSTHHWLSGVASGRESQDSRGAVGAPSAGLSSPTSASAVAAVGSQSMSEDCGDSVGESAGDVRARGADGSSQEPSKTRRRSD